MTGPTSLTGAAIGDYELGEQLGVGGMGTVYHARNRGGEIVAIKIVHPQLLGNPAALDRFLREASIGQRIRHANVVRTLMADSYECDGQTVHALVMEFVEGQTLADMREELGYLPDELCRHVGEEIARALAAIHEVGAIHRDIKPSNVLITPQHEVKVMDLGVAMLVDEAMRLTQTGDFLGSILYAAPEQFDPDATIDGRTDLYALGVVLYELATGRHPFGGTAVVLAPASDREPRDARAVNPNLSPFLDEVIRALLATDPDERPASARVLADLFAAGESAHWFIERDARRHSPNAAARRRLTVPRDTKLYGRETDLAELRTIFGKVEAGRGQMVLLRGEAGIGKTRLVDEFVSAIDKPIHFLFGSYPPGGAATAAGAFASSLLQHFGEQDLEESLRSCLPGLEPIVPAFASLLRGVPLPAGTAALGVDGVRTAFLQVTRSLALQKPTVLFIDDLHCAPETGRSLFATLANAIADDPILLIGAVRPGIHEDWVDTLARTPQAHRLTVDRLGINDLARLLTEAFGSEDLAREYELAIARKSDCNPFFAFEIVRDLRERGEVVRSVDGSWTTSGFLENIRVPASVRELIEHRLRHLTPEEQDLLEIAACCGHRFDPALVTEVAGESLVPALKRFRAIERTHRLIRADGREYVFDHQQVQEALYELLFVQLREQYHAAIGEALEARITSPEGADALRLCHHHFLGGQATRALPHLESALGHLTSQNLHQRRLELTQLALESGALDSEVRVAVLFQRARAARALGDAELDREAAESALGIARGMGNPELESRANAEFASALAQTGKYEEARVRNQEALELARRAGARKQEEAAHVGLGLVAVKTGAMQAAEAHYGQALAIAEELDHPGACLSAHINLGMTLPALGRQDEAREHLERAIGIATEIGDMHRLGIAHSNLGRIHFGRGDLGSALIHARKFREVMRSVGDRRGEVAACIVMCAIWRSMGALEEMARDLDYALRWAERTGDRWMKSYAHMGLAWITDQQGDIAGARETYQRALELRESMNTAEEIADAHAALGDIAARAGESDTASRHFRAALASAKEARGPATILAHCGLAVLGLESAEDAAGTIEQGLETISLNIRIEAYDVLSRTPGGEKYREEAKRWLADLLDQIPPERRAGCRERIRIHRELGSV